MVDILAKSRVNKVADGWHSFLSTRHTFLLVVTNIDNALEPYLHFPKPHQLTFFLVLKYILQKDKKSLLVSKNQTTANQASSPRLSPLAPTIHMPAQARGALSMPVAADIQAQRPIVKHCSSSQFCRSVAIPLTLSSAFRHCCYYRKWRTSVRREPVLKRQASHLSVPARNFVAIVVVDVLVFEPS